jgi:hypothetical protein
VIIDKQFVVIVAHPKGANDAKVVKFSQVLDDAVNTAREQAFSNRGAVGIVCRVECVTQFNDFKEVEK